MMCCIVCCHVLQHVATIVKLSTVPFRTDSNSLYSLDCKKLRSRGFTLKASGATASQSWRTRVFLIFEGSVWICLIFLWPCLPCLHAPDHGTCRSSSVCPWRLFFGELPQLGKRTRRHDDTTTRRHDFTTPVRPVTSSSF